ncbi:glycosyltransferase [Variovorax sp. dw_954]|uniref:glycosyltransferase n=1 Tax=Variovorax sp. dw_954 TaxID=2720078 RepID=UPI001BD43619|nr:glycosyltransferase [Variovorax sp. dw_954]
MSESNPRLALDMYVLAQGVKTGVYRVCDEVFPLLASSGRFDTRLFYRDGDEARAATYPNASRLPGPSHQAPDHQPSDDADILLSPFGVAPKAWLTDHRVLHAHIVYDLIGINRPEYFPEVAAAEVRAIVDSLHDHTVIFAISESTKNDLLAARPDLSPRQVTVIPLAAGTAFRPCEDEEKKVAMRARYGIPAGVPYVLSLATLEIRKNLEQVVNAFVRHLEADDASEMHLVLSGMSGWKLERMNEALSAAAKWRHRIVLTGFVDDEDLSALYSDANCFVYLSRYEGFGLPPLEAMACGTPVICSDNSSLPEVVGEAGLMFDADDVAGVADAIGQIAASDTYRRELSQAGIQRARLFSWARCADIMAETLSLAYARHTERPSNRRRHVLAPGALAARYARPDGIVEANIVDYRNGSHGPHFRRVDPMPAAVAGGMWPTWIDALPASSTKARVEGGLRTRGVLKSASEDAPLVSYITVVRNNPRTLARTIESVQAQTYANVEHIVLDGASTDDTMEVVLRYADKLDYYASEPDKGLYDAVNKAIPLARGQLICVLNSDDWLEPDAAEIVVRRMGDGSGAAMLFTAALVQVEDEVREWHPAFVHPGSYFMCANDCHNGIYATRGAYEKSGPYDTSYKIAADFKWIMTCMEAAVTFIYTREATVNYSLGGTSSDARGHSMECMRVVAERFPLLSPTDVAGLYHCFYLFAGVPELRDYPTHRTEFLRDVFARHVSDPDLMQALGWVSFETLWHPADLQPATPDAAAPAPGARQLVKTALKDVLRRHPTAFALAKRLHASVRK